MRQEGSVEGSLGGRAGGREIVDRLDVGVDAGEQMFAIEAGVEDRRQRLQRALGAAASVTMVEASPETLRWSGSTRKFCAASESWSSDVLRR